MIFPCKDCILIMVCKQSCHKIIYKFDQNIANKFNKYKACLDCGHKLFRLSAIPIFNTIDVHIKCENCCAVYSVNFTNNSDFLIHRTGRNENPRIEYVSGEYSRLIKLNYTNQKYSYFDLINEFEFIKKIKKI